VAPATPRDPTVPPLTIELLASAARLIVPVTATDEVREFIADFAGRYRVPVVVVAEVNDTPVVERTKGDILIHSVPDVFGRVLPAYAGWEFACVHHRIAASVAPVGCTAPIEIDREPDESPDFVTSTLEGMYKRLCQQRGVRPVFGSPAPFGLAFIAPDGIELDSDRVISHRVDLPGLPDLVVVRWAYSS
jgi:hypothetical protein